MWSDDPASDHHPEPARPAAASASEERPFEADDNAEMVARGIDWARALSGNVCAPEIPEAEKTAATAAVPGRSQACMPEDPA
jgi:hypothetical protein